MKNLIFVCLMTTLLGLIVSDSVEARGGGAQSGGGGGGGGGGGFSGGGRHFSGGGGGRHFSGGSGFSGGRHFRGGGHRHGGHRRRHNSYYNIGIGYGAGFYGPGYFGYRPYGYRSYYGAPLYPYGYPSYYSRAIGVPSAPVVYVQREEAQTAQSQTNYWHYCRNPEGYYPYVKKCPEGWLQVAPQPSTQ